MSFLKQRGGTMSLMMSTKDFSERLKNLRKSKKIKQSELAKILNVGRSTVSMWETGMNVPSIDVADKIADLFNVSVDYLLGRTDNPSYEDKDFNIQDFLPEDVKEKLSALETSPTPEYLEKVGEFLINLAKTLRK